MTFSMAIPKARMVHVHSSVLSTDRSANLTRLCPQMAEHWFSVAAFMAQIVRISASGGRT